MIAPPRHEGFPTASQIAAECERWRCPLFVLGADYVQGNWRHGTQQVGSLAMLRDSLVPALDFMAADALRKLGAVPDRWYWAAAYGPLPTEPDE